MEIIVPFLHNYDFDHVIFLHGDLTDCISIVDRHGRIDKGYSITVEPDEDFEHEWIVTIQALPGIRNALKIQNYWFRYNSRVGKFAGDPWVWIGGIRKRFIKIETPAES